MSAMAGEGYDVGPFYGPDALPGLAELDGDALVLALIAAGGQDADWLTDEQLAGNPIRIPSAEYRAFFETLPADLRSSMEAHWGPAPGSLFVDPADGAIVLAEIGRAHV